MIENLIGPLLAKSFEHALREMHEQQCDGVLGPRYGPPRPEPLPPTPVVVLPPGRPFGGYRKAGSR